MYTKNLFTAESPIPILQRTLYNTPDPPNNYVINKAVDGGNYSAAVFLDISQDWQSLAWRIVIQDSTVNTNFNLFKSLRDCQL